MCERNNDIFSITFIFTLRELAYIIVLHFQVVLKSIILDNLFILHCFPLVIFLLIP